MSTTTPSTLPPNPTTSDPGVNDRPRRRRFSADDKLHILEEIDRTKPGEIGAILNREGLYSSNIGRWRQLRDHGVLQGLAPAKLASRQAPANPLKHVVDQLERENAHLCKRLTRAEAVIDVQ